MLRQSSVGLGELGGIRRGLLSLAIELIELVDLTQPRQRPLLQLGITFPDTYEITTHVRPAERQHELPLLDLLHRFVGAVAIDHQYALSIIRKVSFRNIVASVGVQHIDNRVFSRKHPEPPTMAVFAVFFREYKPSRLVRLMIG